MAREIALLEDPLELSRHEGFGEDAYRDLLALQRGELTYAAFDAKYLCRHAILVLDLTGFTENAMQQGSIRSFLRILNAQKVCLPVLREARATLIRAFADDVVALFDAPEAAVDAALEIHQRVALARGGDSDARDWADCCIGVGYGDVYAFGPNLSMGDEMNRTSKLGEDTARGGETLVTENVHTSLAGRPDLVFHRQSMDDLLFPYYRVETKP